MRAYALYLKSPLTHLHEVVKTCERQRNHQEFKCVIPLLQVTQITSYMDVNGFIKWQNVLIS